MRINLFILASMLLTSLLSAQELKHLSPDLGPSNDFTKEEMKLWQKGMTQMNAIYDGDLNYETLPAQDRKMVDSLENTNGPITVGPGCSWYCGGGPAKVTASSQLPSQGKNTYAPENIQDFDLFTAWVPDTKQGVIGQRINFYFPPMSPRVNEIIIYNGYVKNKYLWQANARAKTLKMYVDDQPYAILDLEDTTAGQHFKIEPLQSQDSSFHLILAFEILAVYPGDKYDDLAISEINFDGLDVHCFAGETPVTMADQSTKAIENIQPGDEVLTYDFLTQQWVTTTVTEVIMAQHTHLYELTFETGTITTTADHPFWVNGKGWASLNPEKSNRDYEQQEPVQQLSEGDEVLAFGQNVRLIGVKPVHQQKMTYTLQLKDGDNFVAGGMVVKTEGVKFDLK